MCMRFHEGGRDGIINGIYSLIKRSFSARLNFLIAASRCSAALRSGASTDHNSRTGRLPRVYLGPPASSPLCCDKRRCKSLAIPV